MIKLLLSVFFMAAIYASYQNINESVHSAPENTSRSPAISELKSDIRKLQPLSNYQAITQAPLFDEDRLPEKMVLKKVVKKIKRINNELRVQGLGIAVMDEGILAVIKDLKNGKTMRLRIGEIIYGWSLKSVSNKHFTFVKGEVEKVINFK